MFEDFIEDLRKGRFTVETNRHGYKKQDIVNAVQTYDTLVYEKTPDIMTHYNNFSTNYHVNTWEDCPQPYEHFLVCTTDKNNKLIAWFIWTDPTTYFAVPITRRLGKNTLIDVCFVMDKVFLFTTYQNFVHKRHTSKIKNLHDTLSFVMKINYMITNRQQIIRQINPGHNLASPKTKLKTPKQPKRIIKLVRVTSSGVKVAGRGGVGVPKRPHRRRGHWRHFKNGSKKFIKPIDVNNPTGTTYYLRA